MLKFVEIPFEMPWALIWALSLLYCYNSPQTKFCYTAMRICPFSHKITGTIGLSPLVPAKEDSIHPIQLCASYFVAQVVVGPHMSIKVRW